MTQETKFSVTYNDIEAAARRLAGIAHKTPVLTSRTIDRRTHCKVYFKCENFQRTGSFKFRGAYNALSQLSPEQKEKGVITYSSGNHAQAIALSGQLLGIPATIVMPSNAPDVKIVATRSYGAEVILYDPQQVKREELGRKLAEERNLVLIPPYDHPHVVAGQGTVVKELIEEVGELDILLVCCGGGGLLSGSAIAANFLSPHCKTIGVEPENADDATRSFHTKILHYTDNPDTIADGARTPCLGTLTFPLILHYVSDMVTVSEEALRRTMVFLWERLKIVVEPTGVLAAAALLEGRVTAKDARIGIIISGGNVALSQLDTLLLF
jgi:threo-3-hydroxy-L-aspartate ammonia-lyase